MDTHYKYIVAVVYWNIYAKFHIKYLYIRCITAGIKCSAVYKLHHTEPFERYFAPYERNLKKTKKVVNGYCTFNLHSMEYIFIFIIFFSLIFSLLKFCTTRGESNMSDMRCIAIEK